MKELFNLDLSGRALVAKTICRMMQERQIDPDADFEAAAGRECGYVKAWELPDGSYAVEYGNDGETLYTLDTVPTEELYEWLLHPDSLGPEEIVLEQATIRGLDHVEAATGEEGEGHYYMILAATPEYGPKEPVDYLIGENSEPLRFPAYAEAWVYVSDCEDGPVVLSHNQSGRPRYKIIAFAK